MYICCVCFSFQVELTSIKYAPLLQDAILAMDETILDADQVEILIKFCPTKEEIELLNVKSLLNLPFCVVFSFFF